MYNLIKQNILSLTDGTGGCSSGNIPSVTLFSLEVTLMLLICFRGKHIPHTHIIAATPYQIAKMS
jgi:hypothetical protein